MADDPRNPPKYDRVLRGRVFAAVCAVVIGATSLFLFTSLLHQPPTVTDRVVTYTIPVLHEEGVSKVFDLGATHSANNRIAWLIPIHGDDEMFAFAAIEEHQAKITTPYRQIYLLSTSGQLGNRPISSCMTAFTVAPDESAHCQPIGDVASFVVNGQMLGFSSTPSASAAEPGFTLNQISPQNELLTPDGTGLLIAANCILSFWQLDPHDVRAARLQTTVALDTLLSPGEQCAIGDMQWSPDGHQLSFSNNGNHAFTIEAMPLELANTQQHFINIPLGNLHSHDVGTDIGLIRWQDEQTLFVTNAQHSAIQRINLLTGTHDTMLQLTELASTATSICEMAVAQEQHKLAFSLCIPIDPTPSVDAHVHIIYHIQPDILYQMAL